MDNSYFTAIIGGELITADHCVDIIAALPGIDDNYQTLGAEEALLARQAHAISVATVLQARAAAQAEDWDQTQADEDELTAILGNRLHPIQLDGPWEHPVTLILLAGDYAPYTELAPPAGNVELLDVASERGYLNQLASLGLIQLFVQNPETDES